MTLEEAPLLSCGKFMKVSVDSLGVNFHDRALTIGPLGIVCTHALPCEQLPESGHAALRARRPL